MFISRSISLFAEHHKLCIYNYILNKYGIYYCYHYICCVLLKNIKICTYNFQTRTVSTSIPHIHVIYILDRCRLTDGNGNRTFKVSDGNKSWRKCTFQHSVVLGNCHNIVLFKSLQAVCKISQWRERQRRTVNG